MRGYYDGLGKFVTIDALVVTDASKGEYTVTRKSAGEWIIVRKSDQAKMSGNSFLSEKEAREFLNNYWSLFSKQT
jgi:hypothetical protein